MKKIYSLFLIIFSLTLSAQTAKFHLFFMDSVNNEVISGVKVMVNKSVYISNAKGEVILLIDRKLKQVSITYQKEEYKQISTSLKLNNDTLLVKLIPLNLSLPEVSISKPLPPHVYFGKKGEDVLDYLVTPQFTIVCTYHRINQNYHLILINSDKVVLDDIVFNSLFESLYHNELGYNYLLLVKKIYEIQINNNQFALVEIKPEDFHKKIEYYIAKHDNYFYLKTYSRSKQTKVFILEDAEKKIVYQSTPFCIVTDEKREQQSHIEWDTFMRVRKQEMSQIIPDYDMSSDILEGHEGDRSFMLKNEFQQKYVDHPVQAPFFITQTGLCIYDRYKKLWQQFDFNTHITSIDSINFDLKNHELIDILKNENDQYYLVYKSSSREFFVYAFDISTKQSILVKKLANKDIKHFYVIGKDIYYSKTDIYSDADSFIFKEIIVQ